MDSAEPTLADRLTALAAGGADKLCVALSRRHEDCDKGDFGAKWWRLVADAYEGTGGFRAAVRAASIGDTWGEGSYEVGVARLGKSYLTQFVRESGTEYQRRVASSTYLNLVAPVIDTYHGHIARRPPKRLTSAAPVAAWWERADSAGRSVDEWLSEGIRRAQLFGWCAAIFDRPQGLLPRASARTTATWLEPDAVIDWAIGDDGALDWIRLECEAESSDPLTGDEDEREEYVIWTRTEWARVVIAETRGVKTVESITGEAHGLGRVPVAVLRFRPMLDDDALYGLSQVSDVVPLALALFNTESQLTHHLASAVFALLAVQTDTPEAMQNLRLGTSNGMAYPIGAAAPLFVAPPESVSMQLAVRAEQLVDAIYQTARVERPKASAQGGDVASGIARSYDFQQTETILQGFVARITAFEHECAAIVALWDAAPVTDPSRVVADTAAATTVAYPERYDVAGIQDELAAQFAALTKDVREQLPPTAIKHARLAIALGLNPQADADTEAAIRAEVDAMLARDTAAADHTAAIAALPPAESGALVAHAPGESPIVP